MVQSPLAKSKYHLGQLGWPLWLVLPAHLHFSRGLHLFGVLLPRVDDALPPAFGVLFRTLRSTLGDVSLRLRHVDVQCRSLGLESKMEIISVQLQIAIRLIVIYLLYHLDDLVDKSQYQGTFCIFVHIEQWCRIDFHFLDLHSNKALVKY